MPLYQIPSVVKAGTLRSITPPTPPTGYASWLSKSISQPYFPKIDINNYVCNPNAGNLRTYVAPVSPAWFSNTISQPYFSPINENLYTWPASVGTFSFPVAAPKSVSVSSETISQPNATIMTPIPSVVSGATLRGITAPILPTGAAAWLDNSISQPYFPPININHYVWNANAGNLRGIAAFLPPGIGAWLNDTISQPFFPAPYPPSLYVWPANPATFKSPPVAITFSIDSIGQPIFLTQIMIPSVIKPLLPVAPPTGYAAWLNDSISQPYFPPLNTNHYVWNPNAGNLRSVSAPSGAAAWLSKSISQPYFPPYFEPLYVWNANPALLFTFLHAIFLSDSGSGVDSLSALLSSFGLSETGSGNDSVVSILSTFPIADAGSGNDAISILASFSLAENGSGTDTLSSLLVMLPLTDTGNGADTLSAFLNTFGLNDNGSGADQLSTMLITLPLSDNGLGSDAISSLLNSFSVNDTGSGNDSIGIFVAIPLADIGAGSEAVSIQVQMYGIYRSKSAVQTFMGKLFTKNGRDYYSD